MTPPGSSRGGLRGHRGTRLGRSPFGAAAPSIAVAVGYAVAAMVWVAAGASLPGGRWLAVHLFTLGVLTNLVLAFSDHFTRAVTRSGGTPARWQPAAANAGILLVLLGITTSIAWVLAVGATTITAVVFVSYRRLRTMRKEAVGARFGWIVRIYERAHGAFIHGAVLGFLLGAGLLPGTWYGAARTAHLHINVLGWGGLTLLATLVFFGPTMVRTRIVEGADERAAQALRHGATGLTVAVFLLLGTGAGGGVAIPLRIAAAAAMVLFARGATVTCLPVAAAARRAKPSATRWPVVALSLWFVAIVWADVAMIATGAWEYLDAIGLAAVLGVLVQTIATVLTYVTPMLRSRTFAGRDRLLARFEWGATPRTVAYNAGVVAVVFAAVTGGTPGLIASRAGWAVVIAALASLVVAALAPLPAEDQDAGQPLSQVVRRYRTADDT